LTLVELLTVVAVIAIVIALLLPAVLAARSAAHKSRCKSNLRSMGVALLAFETAHHRLPAGRDQLNLADHSWATAILPYLEEEGLYDRYRWSRPWNDKDEDPAKTKADSAPRRANIDIANTSLSVFLCPSTDHDFSGAIDYGGNYGSELTGLKPGFERGKAWSSGVLLAVNIPYTKDVPTQGLRLNDVADGASHTFMVMENVGRDQKKGGMWANGHNCFSHDRGAVNHQWSKEIHSDHPDIAHALLVDGSVIVLNEKMEREVLGAMSTRAHAEMKAADIP
jgi:type II secretory pathway pseudopilin PulG